MSKKDLYPVQVLNVNPYSIIIGSFIFAVIFFAIGSFWRYYIPMGV